MVVKRVGSAFIAAGVLVIPLVFQLTDWKLTDQGSLLILGLCIAAICGGALLIGWPFDGGVSAIVNSPAPLPLPVPPQSHFIKAGDGASIDLEDTYSAADTFLDLGDRPTVSGRRNVHDPKADRDG